MMTAAATPRKIVFNHDPGLLKPKSRTFDLRSHNISRTNATPKMPELKVKRGAAKSIAMIRSSTTATHLRREMNVFALSRNCAMPEGSAALAKRLFFAPISLATL